MFIRLVGEAIAMADKVVVLSNRPATIKNIYEITMENKGLPSENRKNSIFNKYYEGFIK